MEKELQDKYEKLKKYTAAFGSAAVAFSGGVDSAFLLYAAREALKDRVIAVTAESCLFPKREQKEASEYCRQLGIRQIIVRPEELKIEGFAENPPDRCYLCKRDLFQKLRSAAREQGTETVIEGSNLDDTGDYRPGLRAIAELGIESPLRACGFTKKEIRRLSEALGIPTWNKPSFACLASRFPYGEIITEEKLGRIEQAEQLLLDMGFRQMRVRIHGDIARIELLPEDFPRFMEEANRLAVYRKFREFGFSYTALDVMGYRTGSMNELL